MATRRMSPTVTVLLGGLLSVILAAPVGATGGVKGQPRVGGHSVGVKPLPPLRGPAGPTPLNPAGPTPLNPAGPPPIGAGGPSIGFPRRSYTVQPGFSVGIVGGGANYDAPIGGSFFCEVHNRGYASQSLFFDHLEVADGMYGDDALSYLIDDGGVWIFPAE